MSLRDHGFVLLVWFPGVLLVQSTQKQCPAPQLEHGYFVPEQQFYPHDYKLMYACDDRYKPAEEGWWVTTTCHNGRWSPEPHCIDERACLPPTIPNGKYSEGLNDWYEDGFKIGIKCEPGFEPTGWNATCQNGIWSPLEACERSNNACLEPPKIPNAVVAHQGYREVFPENSQVRYECRAGYTVDEQDSTKSITCRAGKWTRGPTCSRDTTEDTDTEPQPEAEVTYCAVETDEKRWLKSVGTKLIKEGESERLECVKQRQWWFDHFSVATCNNGRISLSLCCTRLEHFGNSC